MGKIELTMAPEGTIVFKGNAMLCRTVQQMFPD